MKHHHRRRNANQPEGSGPRMEHYHGTQILQGRHTSLCCLLCLEMSHIILGAVALSNPPLLNGLANLEQADNRMEQCLLLAAREGSRSIRTIQRSPHTRNPSRRGAPNSEGRTMLRPRVVLHLRRNVQSRCRRLPAEIPLEHTDRILRDRNEPHMTHRFNQCLNKGSID